MKLFEFAIASIVDTNTGHGLVHGRGKIDYRNEELHSRAIRAQSMRGFLAAVGARLRELGADYREKSRQRKAIEQLSHLNDHYLDDIGLTRGDIAAVKLGRTSLQVLNDDRRARLAVAPLDYVETGKVDSRTEATVAANERNYVGAKCA